MSDVLMLLDHALVPDRDRAWPSREEERRRRARDAVRSLNGGRPIESRARAALESRLGHDFRDVRVHDDAAAANAAAGIDADAYTLGRHVGFARGRYRPGTASGRGLLAHELTHAAQQHGAPAAPGDPAVTSPDGALEREARAAFDAAVARTRVSRAPALALMRQQQGQPAQAAPLSPGFSVDRPTYEAMIRRGIASLGGRLLTAHTLAPFIAPMLRAMLAQVTWQDGTGVRHGGGAVAYPLPGGAATPNLRLVLDDRLDPPDHGRFAQEGGEAVIYLRVRGVDSAEVARDVAFHEGLHLMESLITTHGTAFMGPQAQGHAARALQIGRFRHETAGIRRELRDLATLVNQRRPQGRQISDAQLDRMAPWLMEEIQVRAEAEVMRLLAQVEEIRAQPRAPGSGLVFMDTPAHLQVNRRMALTYVFEFSHVFEPGDRAGATPEEERAIGRLVEILEGFFRLGVRRRFDLGAFPIQRIPRARDVYQPPPLTPPSFGPLPTP